MKKKSASPPASCPLNKPDDRPAVRPRGRAPVLLVQDAVETLVCHHDPVMRQEALAQLRSIMDENPDFVALVRDRPEHQHAHGVMAALKYACKDEDAQVRQGAAGLLALVMGSGRTSG